MTDTYMGSRVLADILKERQRQISVEGYTPAHDDDHHYAGEISAAGACYAMNAACVLHPMNGTPLELSSLMGLGWPWESKAWKPKDPRRDLVRAGALIVAEIERLDRTTEARRP